MPDPLATLHRLRRLATDQAQRTLAAALAAARDAEARLAAAQTALTNEAAAAPNDPAHPLAGAFAAWLPAAQSRRAAAAGAVRDAEAEITAARAALSQARAAARAVEIVTDERAESARRERLRRDQNIADDFNNR